MAEVKVLVRGKHQAEDDKLFIGATVTLIQSDKNIVVDPGYLVDQAKVVEELAKNGLKPADIDIVFLTHTHIDHTSNLNLFPQARVYCKLKSSYPGQYHVPAEGYLKRTDIKDGLILAKDVEYLLTPGHVDDHVSLLVNTEDGMVVIAGDAIANQAMIDIAKKPLLYSDLKQYDASRQKILAVADYVIPGHGDRFKLDK